MISIEDLGGVCGSCEKTGCGTPIRYEHLIYHPQIGYISVGSTCIDYLTQEEQFISKTVLNTEKKISNFLNNSTWKKGLTKTGKKYNYTIQSQHQIKIFGKQKQYYFQIALKTKGRKLLDYGKFITPKDNKTLGQVKELAFIVLKGLTTKKEKEKEILRTIYKKRIS